MAIELIDIPTERTTAATDLVMAFLAGGCALQIRRLRDAAPWKVNLWICVFALVATASLFGAVAHGFRMSDTLNRFLWQPLYLTLGLAVGLFMVGAVYDGRGPRSAGRTLPFLLVAGVLFFTITRIFPGSFLVFLIYEALALMYALAVYGSLALGRRLPGAEWMAAGVLLMIIAAVVQATKGLTFHLIWPFDHNGVFHLVQMAGLVALTRGLSKGLKPDADFRRDDGRRCRFGRHSGGLRPESSRAAQPRDRV
jgi:hypothetical protein